MFSFIQHYLLLLRKVSRLSSFIFCSNSARYSSPDNDLKISTGSKKLSPAFFWKTLLYAFSQKYLQRLRLSTWWLCTNLNAVDGVIKKTAYFQRKLTTFRFLKGILSFLPLLSFSLACENYQRIWNKNRGKHSNEVKIVREKQNQNWTSMVRQRLFTDAFSNTKLTLVISRHELSWDCHTLQ